ncbi:MAG TPA: hypothetical protein VF810_04765 [Patescibacteria group bacterium]
MKIVSVWRGFTQVELILSMGILMVLISILTTLFGQILDVQTQSKATSSVDQNGRFMLARLIHDMQSASNIVTPAAPGSQSATLQINVNSVNYIYNLDNNGNLLLTNNLGTNALNSYDASISGLMFTRIGNGDINDTVRVAFTVTSRVQQANVFEQKSYQTTLGLQ